MCFRIRFARDASVLRSAGDVLLKTGKVEADGADEAHGAVLRRWLVATDAFDLSDDETRQAIYDVRIGLLVLTMQNIHFNFI